MLRYLLVFFMSLSLSGFSKDTFHAILICDKASEMKSLYKNDVEKMELFLSGFCKYANMNLKVKKISARNVDLKKIAALFPKIQSKKQNVLIYYSGKDRYSYGVEDFPSIKSKGNQPYFTPGMISKECAKKNSNSFMTIIFDCYNEQFGYETDGEFLMREWTKERAATIKKLFCGHKGALTISSCSSGGQSFGFNEETLKGGLFTNMFLSMLLDSKKKTTWDTILNRVSNGCYHFPYIKDQDLRVPIAHQKILYNLTYLLKKNAEVKTK